MLQQEALFCTVTAFKPRPVSLNKGLKLLPGGQHVRKDAGLHSCWSSLPVYAPTFWKNVRTVWYRTSVSTS